MHMLVCTICSGRFQFDVVDSGPKAGSFSNKLTDEHTRLQRHTDAAAISNKIMADTKQTTAASCHKLQQKESHSLLSTGAAMKTTVQLKKVTLHQLFNSKWAELIFEGTYHHLRCRGARGQFVEV